MIINGYCSSCSHITSGVPQESVLKSLLFVCNTNDLPTAVKSTLKLYADDVLLYRTIYSISDCELQQNDVKIVDKWVDTWQMDFNLEFVKITNKKHALKHCYYLQGEQIKSEPNAKYRGVVIDEHLLYHLMKHVKMIANKLSRNFYKGTLVHVLRR